MSEAKEALRFLADRAEGDGIEAAIRRSARLAGLTYSRAYEIYYGRARSISEDEWSRMSAARARKQHVDDINEIRRMQTRLAVLEARMRQADPEFFAPDIDALESKRR